jgi:FkbM family methyltransferase
MIRIIRSINARFHGFLKRRGIVIEQYNFDTSQELRLVRMLAANGVDLVLDVGANTGGYAAMLRGAGYQGRILSFEPLSGAHERLVAVTKQDPMWAAAPRMALGDHDGEVTINISGNSVSSSILPMTDSHRIAAPDSAYVGAEIADVRMLDSVKHEFLDMAKSPFLKIDAQGYETHVLAGAASILPRLAGLQLELSVGQLYEGQQLWLDVIASLEQTGLELWAIVPGFFEPATGRMLQCDGVFFRK